MSYLLRFSAFSKGDVCRVEAETQLSRIAACWMTLRPTRYVCREPRRQVHGAGCCLFDLMMNALLSSFLLWAKARPINAAPIIRLKLLQFLCSCWSSAGGNKLESRQQTTRHWWWVPKGGQLMTRPRHPIACLIDSNASTLICLPGAGIGDRVHVANDECLQIILCDFTRGAALFASGASYLPVRILNGVDLGGCCEWQRSRTWVWF